MNALEGLRSKFEGFKEENFKNARAQYLGSLVQNIALQTWVFGFWLQGFGVVFVQGAKL